MAEYVVKWKQDNFADWQNHQNIEAENAHEAFRLATTRFPRPEYQYVTVINTSAWSFFDERTASNPHYLSSKVIQKKENDTGEHKDPPTLHNKPDQNRKAKTSPPEVSGWALFHSFLGWIGIAIGLILLLCTLYKEDAAELLMASVIVFFSGVGNFFAAFMINIQTDMRHYLKEISAAQKKMAESFERLEGR